MTKNSQFNICLRMVLKHERLLSFDEMKIEDTNFSPVTQNDGFDEKKYTNKALILDFDDTLRFSIGPNKWPEKPDQVRLLPNRIQRLKEYQSLGYMLLGASNQSSISKGLPEVDAIACYDETLRLLGINIEYIYCPHRSSPVSCYCRKPMPGMGVYWIVKHKLKADDCIMVGDAQSDKDFADKCGFNFYSADDFFSPEWQL
jgi:HAD superfamily hydrolase (TIGR01662 family)